MHMAIPLVGNIVAVNQSAVLADLATTSPFAEPFGHVRPSLSIVEGEGREENGLEIGLCVDCFTYPVNREVLLPSPDKPGKKKFPINVQLALVINTAGLEVDQRENAPKTIDRDLG